MSTLWDSMWAPKRPAQQECQVASSSSDGRYASIQTPVMSEQMHRTPADATAAAPTATPSLAVRAHANGQVSTTQAGLEASRWDPHNSRDKSPWQSTTEIVRSPSNHPRTHPSTTPTRHHLRGPQEPVWVPHREPSAYERSRDEEVLGAEDPYDADLEDFVDLEDFAPIEDFENSTDLGLSSEDAEAIARCYDSDIDLDEDVTPATASLRCAPPSPEPVECGICMEPVGTKGGPQALPCLHVFCSDCISTWLHEKPTCPNCRNQVEDHESYWVENAGARQGTGGRHQGWRAGRRRRHQ